MNRRELFLDFIIKAEGGYVNHHDDPGGETKYGISKRAYPHLDIKNLTVKQAKNIYLKDYYNAVNIDALIDDLLALSVFDFAVNAGKKRAVILLQTLLEVKTDGILGAKTAAAANQVKDLGVRYNEARKSYYRSLATFKKFGKGWLKRVDMLALHLERH